MGEVMAKSVDETEDAPDDRDEFIWLMRQALEPGKLTVSSDDPDVLMAYLSAVRALSNLPRKFTAQLAPTEKP
jgi:hypothetical protein